MSALSPPLEVNSRCCCLRAFFRPQRSITPLTTTNSSILRLSVFFACEASPTVSLGRKQQLPIRSGWLARTPKKSDCPFSRFEFAIFFHCALKGRNNEVGGEQNARASSQPGGQPFPKQPFGRERSQVGNCSARESWRKGKTNHSSIF